MLDICNLYKQELLSYPGADPGFFLGGDRGGGGGVGGTPLIAPGTCLVYLWSGYYFDLFMTSHPVAV